jgi:hypothetical protein
VFRWLSSGNPYNALFLLLYGIAVKYYFLVHPVPPVLDPASDGWLFPLLVHNLQAAGMGIEGFAITAFLLLFAAALLLNSIVNRFRLLPGSSYFPAYCFLVFSSFFQEWNLFSAPLIAAPLLMILLGQLFQLYATQNGRSKAFGLGFLAGIISLFYLPFLGILLAIWLTLLISRPFRLAEWILALAGLLCPYYFLATGLFLAGRLSLFHTWPIPGFSYPHLQGAYWTLAGLILLIWWFLFGSIRLQQGYMKMMIHTRKNWQVLLVLTCLGLALPLCTTRFSFPGWLTAFGPMAVFISLGLWHLRKGWVGLVVHLSALIYIVLFQWVY